MNSFFLTSIGFLSIIFACLVQASEPSGKVNFKIVAKEVDVQREPQAPLLHPRHESYREYAPRGNKINKNGFEKAHKR